LLATSLIVSMMPLLLARPFEVAGVAARLLALLALERVVLRAVRLLPLAGLVLRVARLLELEPFRVWDVRFFAALRPLRLAVDLDCAVAAVPPDFARAAFPRRSDGFEVRVCGWRSAMPHSSLVKRR